MTTIQYKIGPGATKPCRATDGAAGYDLFIPNAVFLPPGEVVTVDTGVSIQLPSNLEAQVRARSSAHKSGVMLMNSPGTIDWDYRGTIKLVLYNYTKTGVKLPEKTRVAQLVFTQVATPELTMTDKLDETVRGEGGFGSTGETRVTRDTGFVKADGRKFKLYELLKKMEANGLSLEMLVNAVDLIDEAGKNKYSPKNWLLSQSPEPFLDAAHRHSLQHLLGEDIDPDSKRAHLEHNLANALFALGIYYAQNSRSGENP